MDYKTLVSPENLFSAFDEFKRGKRKKKDVMLFERNLEENIFELSVELLSKTYSHGPYSTFYIWDPKFRIINKAGVRDRVVHHVLFQYLYGLFDKTFIHHSYSSRISKGTHKGMYAMHEAMRKISKNFTEQRHVLKCDIRKFFESVDHEILFQLIGGKVFDPDILWLIQKVIDSYSASTHTHTHTHTSGNAEFPLAT